MRTCLRLQVLLVQHTPREASGPARPVISPVPPAVGPGPAPLLALGRAAVKLRFGQDHTTHAGRDCSLQGLCAELMIHRWLGMGCHVVSMLLANNLLTEQSSV